MSDQQSLRVRVALQVGYVGDDDSENITGEISSEESFWAGGDFTNAEAVALYDKLAAIISQANAIG